VKVKGEQRIAGSQQRVKLGRRFNGRIPQTLEETVDLGRIRARITIRDGAVVQFFPQSGNILSFTGDELSAMAAMLP
jgi:hypothetical protein